ncbi:MAG: thiamine pyrophosphate-dependent enzyme, partial [Streptosporangiaceae bacterium]
MADIGQLGADPLEQHFASAVRALTGPSASELGGALGGALGGLSPERAVQLLDAQLTSRSLDVAARLLRARGTGYYTIGSAGHEGNAGVAAALRVTDPALLHYRSGAFYLARAAQAGRDGTTDVLLGLLGAAAEPIAGGRHKVFGHRDLNVIPQTSTIASHLPRAIGVAFALDRARRLGLAVPWPDDALVVCSFGDASANHSTAAGALNTAAYCAYQGLPLPLLLVCEDNGLGISVRTPPGWITATRSGNTVVPYFRAGDQDVAQVHAAALAAATFVRERRAPAFLHLPVVRLGGHAGSDVESAYR